MSDAAKAEPLPELELALDEPVEFGGKSYSSVVLREPKAREVKAALAAIGWAETPDAMFVYNISLMSAVAGLPRQVVEAIPVRRFNEGARYLESFLGDGQGTGAS